MQSEQKIIQVMPSDGWRAALVECDFEEGLRLFEEPLVGWALIEDSDGGRHLEGMVLPPGADFVVLCYRVFSETKELESPIKFLGYLKSGEDLDRYQEEAERAYALWRAGEEKDIRLYEAGWTEHTDRSWGRRWESPDGRVMNRRQALKELQEERVA